MLHARSLVRSLAQLAQLTLDLSTLGKGAPDVPKENGRGKDPERNKVTSMGQCG